MVRQIFKIVAIITIISLSIGLFSCEKKKETEDPSLNINQNGRTWITNEKTEFDEAKIVLSFAALADTHQEMGNEAKTQRMIKVINLAEKYAGGYLDAITVSGDMTNKTDRNATNRQNDILQFKDAVEGAVDVKETAIIYSLGNHDNDPQYTNVAEMSKIPDLFKEKLGEDYFTNDVDEGPNGSRHAVVNGFHFIACNPVYYWRPDGYGEELKTWLLETLVDITSKDPNKPIFVLGHAPSYDTVIRSYYETWYDKDLDEIMRNFPQVVFISGHMHDVLQDERCIVQKDYTCVTTGSVHDEGIDWVSEYDMNAKISNRSSYGNKVSNTTCQCILIEVDENNNIRITRIDGNMDNGEGSTVKEPWYVPAPQNDLSHLIPYSRDYRTSQNTAPEFEEGTELSVTKLSNSQIKLTIPAAVDDDMVHYYRLESNVVGSDTLSHMYYLSPFMLFYKSGAEMTNPIDFIATDYIEGKTYEIRVYAVDIWGAESAPLEYTITN